jgi:hypothetical protein
MMEHGHKVRTRTKNHDVQNMIESGHIPRKGTNNHETHSKITKSTTNAQHLHKQKTFKLECFLRNSKT